MMAELAPSTGHSTRGIVMDTDKKKIPPSLRPEVAERTWSARESWRVFGIMAEFVEAPSGCSTSARR